MAKPLELFVLAPAAGCTVKNANVKLAAGHKADAHKDEADSGVHKHENARGESEGKGAHSEFHAAYEITCKAPGALTGIEFKYFDRFKGAEDLEVNVITAKGQRHYEVERGAPRIALEGMM